MHWWTPPLTVWATRTNQSHQSTTFWSSYRTLPKNVWAYKDWEFGLVCHFRKQETDSYGPLCQVKAQCSSGTDDGTILLQYALFKSNLTLSPSTLCAVKVCICFETNHLSRFYKNKVINCLSNLEILRVPIKWPINPDCHHLLVIVSIKRWTDL